MDPNVTIILYSQLLGGRGSCPAHLVPFRIPSTQPNTDCPVMGLFKMPTFYKLSNLWEPPTFGMRQVLVIEWKELMF